MISGQFCSLEIHIAGDWTSWVLNPVQTSSAEGGRIFCDYQGFLFSYPPENNLSLVGYTGNETTLEVPSVVQGRTITSIENYAFQDCANLTSITISSGVTNIGASAFQHCSSLTTLSIPSSVTMIGSGAFANCGNLTSITIPESVTSIEDQTFLNCTSLANITIPVSVTAIRNFAFSNCTSLTNITIPNSVTTIEFGAFQGAGLTSITIPNSVMSIGAGAFSLCKSLTNITMPERFTTEIAMIGISGQVATDYLINALANNDAFVTAVANKIKATGGNYGIATQSGLSSTITSAIEPLASKTQITTAINEGKAAGVASVTASPNTWSLFTTSQIQNMAIGDLVLTKQVNGQFVLNYDIEQSEDLQNWTPYLSYALPMTNLPTDKAFVRIKAK
jgi:hypothetical protein